MFFNYLPNITNDSRRTRKMKSRISMAKAIVNEKRLFCTCKLELNLRNTLVVCYILSLALFGAESWPLQKVDRKYLEKFEM
jgi:hypothetical protein